MVPTLLRWVRQAVDGSFRLHQLNIGLRLTVCFLLIIVAMLVGNGVLLWHFHQAQKQAERRASVDQVLIAVLQAHTGLMSFYERLDVLAQSEDTVQLLQQIETLRSTLLDDTQRARDALSRLPAEGQLDPALLPTLLAIQGELPSQVEAIANLAKSGAWGPVRLRLANQVRPLESRSAALVESVNREAAAKRAQAVLNIRQAQRQIFLVVPVTAAITLVFAALLGSVITRSITQPLGRLVEGATALAKGDFSHQVPATGDDEITRLGNAFNDMVVKLREVYRDLQTSETYLTEAQKLSLTGSFGWIPSSGEIVWSRETFRIFDYDPAIKPTVEMVLERTHPEDRSLVQHLIDRASRTAEHSDLDHRLLMPDGSVKHLHVVAHAVENDPTGEIRFVGALMDVTAAKQSQQALEQAFREIKVLKDRLQSENIVLRDEIDRSLMFEQIVGTSPPLRKVLSRISKVAPTDSTVLITGETGAGKELVARAIHRRSRRSARAFVSVNCASIPRDLIASELFGHEKGAFTGATQRRLGRFEVAEGGTIFLDEVGELPPETQIALLRVLQEREFERIGAAGSIRTDVRVIAATNRDLEAAIAAGTFRSDLFYRLNVFPIEMPSLRERREDIPLLVEYFIDRFARQAGKSFRALNKRSLDLLQSYPWPGNIRELQNVIERSVIVCETEHFSVDESWLSRKPPVPVSSSGLESLRRRPSEEKEIIEAALSESGGRVYGPFGAAAKLGIPRSTLEHKIRSLKINKNSFKSSDPSKNG